MLLPVSGSRNPTVPAPAGLPRPPATDHGKASDPDASVSAELRQDREAPPRALEGRLGNVDPSHMLDHVVHDNTAHRPTDVAPSLDRLPGQGHHAPPSDAARNVKIASGDDADPPHAPFQPSDASRPAKGDGSRTHPSSAAESGEPCSRWHG